MLPMFKKAVRSSGARSLLVALTLAATLTAAPRPAHAGTAYYTGYVCRIIRQYTSTSSGTNGNVSVAIYDGGTCTGNYVGAFFLCGTGATLSGCQGILANDAVMASFTATMLQAKTAGYQIQFLVETGGSTSGIDQYLF